LEGLSFTCFSNTVIGVNEKFCLGKKKVEINDEQLAEVIKVDTMKTQMQKAVDRMKEDYVKNLSLRSTTGI
jgi:ribosome recycling factor